MTVVSGFDLFGGEVIKSIQRGSGYLQGYSGTGVKKEITISPIVPSNAIIIVTEYSSSNQPNYVLCTGTIVNATTISVERPGGSTDRTNFSWEVIEFTKLKSKQDGVLDFYTSNSYFVNLESINSNKGIVFAKWKKTDIGNFDGTRFIYLLTDTRLTFTVKAMSQNRSMHWQVVEFE